MEQINIISTSIVQPSNPNTSTQRIELTPFDLPFLVTTYIQRGFLFLKPTQVQLKELGNDLIPHLKASLSRALDIFPPVAGRIDAVENDDKTTSFFIDCNGSGAQFVHAVANGVTVADFLEPKYFSDTLFSLFPFTNVYCCEGISKPLLAIQVTELVDGIFITLSCNHAITDGKGFSHLVNTWSEISRSPENITQPLPVFGFPFIDHQIRIPNFSFHEITSNTNFLTPTPCLVRIFHFTKDKIAELKSKARSETGSTTISSLQVTLGHLWRSVIRNRHVDTDQQVHIGLGVDMRKTLQPQLPENYFRNAAVLETATTTAGELLGHGLGFAAMQINKMVSAQTAEASREKLEGLVKRPQLPKLTDQVLSNFLFVGSSPRFDYYGDDFGWGKPVALRGATGSSSMDGLVLAFPGSEEGCVDLQVFLAAQTLQAMDNDAEFMQAVST